MKSQTGNHAEKVKCLVIDLDNTLWDGVLIEDGRENLSVNRELIEVLQQLDRRGILLSIASKNDEDAVVPFLKELGIEDLFVFPKINWNPKSQNIAAIAADIDIGLDTLAFIDDNQFELEEVQFSHPEVRLLNARDYGSILHDPVFTPDRITRESKSRRQFYRQQMLRKRAEQTHNGLYRDFLRECNLEVTVRGARESDLDRVVEIVQRTNQMNFSTNRHGPERVKEMLHSRKFNMMLIEASDRFGRYGSVGVVIIQVVQAGVWDIQDLMFSCRIQGKGVDEAVIIHLMQAARDEGVQKLFGNFRKTQRNRQFLNTYRRLGFGLQEQHENCYRYVFYPSRDNTPPANHVMIKQEA